MSSEIEQHHEELPRHFPQDVTPENCLYVRAEVAKKNSIEITEGDFMDNTQIDEHGIAVCEDPKTHAKTQLVVLVKNNEIGEICQANLQRGDDGSIGIVMPEGARNEIRLVLGRDFTGIDSKRTMVLTRILNAFQVAPRTNDKIPFAIEDHYPHRLDPEEETSKYVELLSVPSDESPVILGHDDIASAVQGLGMNPAECVEIDGRYYHELDDKGKKSTIKEPLLASSQEDGSNITVRVFQPYQFSLDSGTRDLSFGPPTQTQGNVGTATNE